MDGRQVLDGDRHAERLGARGEAPQRPLLGR